ncbi:GTPase-activating protein BEM2 KNAG_0G01710 [Huiozyma naganishii CBS 8797]|uniref:Rho-GAP domain-containing protein n=1 Tax=Huiozyma naganishii (strain ATCC MYA-139 / BCRC 22969 / CBS 8797 / KCTC 17520 / NBRC 10181 / NCYC 3082 / Yp74L-3) TaxID=1071383 RepID=J7S7X4_HUIN7|nr:hypothetical protein KNAG_0G01710 [Kazachstania naganishii CBS 8797]CCK71229.1 hypothetical protein KNAG_0G01710 [Kazachstania naganishii CBS 8797]
MRNFLWSSKSGKSSSNKNGKDSSSHSSSARRLQLTNSSSSSTKGNNPEPALSLSASHSSGLSSYLQARSSTHGSRNASSTGHLPADPPGTSRSGNDSSKERYMRNNISQPLVYSTNSHNRSATSIVSLKEDAGSVLSDDANSADVALHKKVSSPIDEMRTIMTASNRSSSTIASEHSKEHGNPIPLVPSTQLKSTLKSNIHEEVPVGIERPKMSIKLNGENYDDTVFKTGWINKSHGQIMVPNPSTKNTNTNGTHHQSRTEWKAKRESRMFSPQEMMNATSSSSKLEIDNETVITTTIDPIHTASTGGDSQIMVPDYRIYRAQLKGSLLRLYKSGMTNSIKSFDPSMPLESDTNVSSNLSVGSMTPASQNDQAFNKRATIAGGISRPTANAGQKLPVNDQTANNLHLRYLSCKFPHPDLELDRDLEKLTGGTVESICHTILFYDNEDFGRSIEHHHHNRKPPISIMNLLLMLPLINNFIKFLNTFNQMGLTFTKHDAKLTSQSTQYCKVSSEMDDLITERLALVIKTILDMFPGFLLDDQMFQATIRLLDTISLHNDEICNSLKVAVAKKHNALMSLTYFTRRNSADKNGTKQPVNSKMINEILDISHFLTMDVKNFANDIHQINLKFDKIWAPRLDYGLLYSSNYINSEITALNPLVFDNTKNVHFLGRLLISHLFPTDPSVSRTDPKLRAKILTKWVHIGCRLEHLGDMVSWLTIATIICSIPILRLQQSWQFVPESVLKIILKDWVPTIIQLDRRQMSSKSTNSVFILAPPNLDDPFIRANVISYFGDLIINVNNLPTKSNLRYLEKKISRTKNAFHKWEQRLESVDSTNNFTQPPPEMENSYKTDPSSSVLWNFWKHHVAQSPLNIKGIMELSLKFEPPVIDQLSYSKIGAERSPLLTGSYLPVLFNELLPNYVLFPKISLIGAAGTIVNGTIVYPPPRSSARLSTANPINQSMSREPSMDSSKSAGTVTGIENIDVPTVQELSTKQSTKQMLMKSIRDVFNIDTDLFNIADDLVFKSTNSVSETSRPVSVVVESPKRFSQQSASNTKTRSSQDVSGHLSRTLQDMDFFKSIGDISDPTLQKTVINVVLKSASLNKIFDLLVLTVNVFSKLIQTSDFENYCSHEKKRVSSVNSNSSDSVRLIDFAFIKLAMDSDVFTETFFNTYKSFTTTSNVLENLAKRFIGAKSCAYVLLKLLGTSESAASAESIEFPVWDATVPKDTALNTAFIIKIQVGAAEALLHMIINHYNDLTDNLENHSTMLDIFKIMDQEISVEWPKKISSMKGHSDGFNEEIADTEIFHEKLREVFNSAKSNYQKRLYRPVGISKMRRRITEQLELFKPVSFEQLVDLCCKPGSNGNLCAEFGNLRFEGYKEIMDWVSHLDDIITGTFKMVSKHEWVEVYQILELTSKKSLTSFFAYPQFTRSVEAIGFGSPHLNELEISSIFSWISTLVDPLDTRGHETVFAKLPQSVQLLVKLHSSLVSFFIIQVINPSKALHDRIETCCVMLQLLNYVRWKNDSLNLFDFDLTSNLSPHIPSFIETAICDSILSPESRAFEHCWVAAAEKLHGKENKEIKSIKDIIDHLDPSFIKHFMDIDSGYLTSKPSFCPCPGWFISRLLDISQFVPNMSTSNSKLINFDKRRFVNNIICNVADIGSQLSGTGQDYRRNKIASDWVALLFNDFKDLDNSLRKRTFVLASAEAKMMKFQEIGLFTDILSNEVGKLRRDQKKLELLNAQETYSKPVGETQSNLNRKEKDFVLPPHNRTSPTNVAKSISTQQISSPVLRNKRSSVMSTMNRNSSANTSNSSGVSKKIGGFFRRPFSIAGFNTSSSNYSLNSSLSQENASRKAIDPTLLPELNNNELNDSKPVYSIKTFEIKNIMEVINHRRNSFLLYAFKIIMQDGSEHMIQATNLADQNEWIRTIRWSKRYAFHSQKFGGKTHNKIFGVPLESVCEREGTTVPTIIVKLLEEIELRGLDEVGLYRIPGSVGSINALKNAFDEEGAVNISFTLEDDRWFEINAIAGCFKMYLRELPDSLFSNELLGDFAHLVQQYKARQISYSEYRRRNVDMLHILPVCYFETMKRIVYHLNKVHQHVDNNRMDASNLAIVFSMSFIDQEDLANSMGPTLGAVQSILQDYIKNPGEFFT